MPVPVALAEAEDDDVEEVLIALVAEAVPWSDEVLLDADVDVDELDDDVEVVVPLALDARPTISQ